MGNGSFGTCYKVLRKDTGEIFVWKAVDYGKMTEEKKKLLVSEVNVLSSLHHSNIVKYYDRIIHKPTTTIYIVMEWCAGGDLSALIHQCKKTDMKFDEKFVWSVLYQLSRALRFCHSLLPEGPILHRDIKPANVFLDGNGNVKLGDFGFAHLLRGGQSSISCVSVIGTPFYMSPETLQKGMYGEKSDVWSLGCLLYELCSLHPPFGGSNLHQLVRNVQIGRYDRIPLEYSEDLHSLIRVILTADHRSRPNIETILHHPQVVVHVVQASLAERGKELRASDSKNSHKLEKAWHSSSFGQSSCRCQGEVVELKDVLSFKMEKLKEWETTLLIREVELDKRERRVIKQEKHVVESKNMAKEQLSQAKCFLHYCQSQHQKKNRCRKTEILNHPSGKLSDDGETSFTFPTSTKLNPNVVEKPAVFTKENSEKRVHFGTLPIVKNKCKLNIEKDSYRSISHILIDGFNFQANPSLKQSQMKMAKRQSCATGGSSSSSSKSGLSASSNVSRKLFWDEERRQWLEQKRALYLQRNKENFPATTCTAFQVLGQAKKNSTVKKSDCTNRC